MRPLLVLVLLAALVPGILPAAATGGDARPRTRATVLTADGPALRYRVRDDGRVVVRAARRRGDANRREIVTARRRPSRDQTVCATWARASSWRVQPGLAVRVSDRRGRVRAVTLTKNIAFHVQTVLNILTWDTARRGDPWRAVAQLDVADVLVTDDGRLEPLPWRVCLRVEGRRVGLKIWLPRNGPEPGWDDPVAARSVRLPAAFVRRGRPGWYVGHVPAGGRFVWRDLTVGR